MFSVHTPFQKFLKYTYTLSFILYPLAAKVLTTCNFANNALKQSIN